MEFCNPIFDALQIFKGLQLAFELTEIGQLLFLELLHASAYFLLKLEILDGIQLVVHISKPSLFHLVSHWLSLAKLLFDRLY